MHNHIADHSPAKLTGQNGIHKLGASLQRWLSASLRKMHQRKMIAELHAMDDRLLRDIGLFRSDIARVVNGFDDAELRMAPVARPLPVARAEASQFKKAA